MEHPNMSLRLNNMDNSFGHFKKHMHGDTNDSTADSGYITNLSISQTVASSSRLSNLSGASFKRSLDLAPINELHEFNSTDASHQSYTAASFGAIETPTTKSIRQLSAFHINTPPTNRSETTPTKGNYFAQVHHSGSSRSGRKKSQHRFNYSPYKADSKQRSPRERRILFDANSENDCVPNVHDESIGFSPIGSYDNGSSKIVPTKNVFGQRYPSGIESSTPKLSTLRRIQTQSIVKPNHDSLDDNQTAHMIRKVQSFSPAKMVLRELNFQNLPANNANNSNELMVQSAAVSNPASTFLALSNDRFDQLFGSCAATIHKTPTKQQQATAEQLYKSPLASTSTNQSPYKTRKIRSRIFREFSRKPVTRPTATTTKPSTQVDSLNESDIQMALSEISKHAPASNETGTNSVEYADLSVIGTPNVGCRDVKSGRGDTPIRDDSMTHSMRIEANRTPTKRFDRSISFNPTNRHYSPEKKKNKITYDRLPCTPPKNYTKRPLKRTANVSLDVDDTPATTAPSAKRKLYETSGIRKEFFNDIRRLDILKLLANFNLGKVTASILDSLNERELQAVRSTSKSWSRIIKSDRVNNERRITFLKKLRDVKENSYHQRMLATSMISNNNNSTHDMSIKRQPFGNVQNSSVDETPEPVSPSTYKFREHQEVRTIH